MLKFVPVAFGDPRALSAKPVAFVAKGTKSFATRPPPENWSAFSRGVRWLSGGAGIRGEGVGGGGETGGDVVQRMSRTQGGGGVTSVRERTPLRVGRFHHLLT